MAYNMVVAGIGGQGSILASHIIADAAILNKLKNESSDNVRVGETFGAAQRGGAVASHVRIGNIHGPLVRKGCADVVVALEPLEGLRIGVDYLSPDGIAILNTSAVSPVDANIGAVTYPAIESIQAALSGICQKVIAFDATKLALEAGSAKCMNIVMLGALFASGRLPFDEDTILKAIVSRLPERIVPMNLKAFQSGKEAYLNSD